MSLLFHHLRFKYMKFKYIISESKIQIKVLQFRHNIKLNNTIREITTLNNVRKSDLRASPKSNSILKFPNSILEV